MQICSKTPKEGDGETSVEELGAESSMHEEAPENWGEDYDNDEDDDPDLLRFQATMRSLVDQLCT
jgi:hypothetical protein